MLASKELFGSWYLILSTQPMQHIYNYWDGNAVYLCLAGQVYVGVGIESKQSSSYVGKHSAVTWLGLMSLTNLQINQVVLFCVVCVIFKTQFFDVFLPSFAYLRHWKVWYAQYWKLVRYVYGRDSVKTLGKFVNVGFISSLWNWCCGTLDPLHLIQSLYKLFLWELWWGTLHYEKVNVPNEPLHRLYLFRKIAGSFQFIGFSNTNYGNRVNESKTADSRNRCEIIDEFCPVANEQKNTYV